MKKTYIKPETIVVALNVRDNVLQALSAPTNVSISNPTTPGTPTVHEIDDLGGREVIRSRGAWEEW